jgi:hypothetical protein
MSLSSCFLLALKLDIIKIKFMSKNTKNHFRGLSLLLDSDSVLDLLHDLSILNSKQILTSRWFVNLQQKFNFNFFFWFPTFKFVFPQFFITLIVYKNLKFNFQPGSWKNDVYPVKKNPAQVKKKKKNPLRKKQKPLKRKKTKERLIKLNLHFLDGANHLQLQLQLLLKKS